MVGRAGVEADDVADFQLERRVAGDLECLDLVGFQAVVLQDAEHRRDGDPHLFRQRPQRPVTCVRRRHRELDQFTDLVPGYRLAAPSPGDVVKQAADTLRKKAVPPALDRRLRHAGGPHRLRQGEAVAEGRMIVALWTCLRIGCGSVLISSRSLRTSLLREIRVLLLFAIAVLLPLKTARLSPGAFESYPTGKWTPQKRS